MRFSKGVASCNQSMSAPSAEDLAALFTKPYGAPAPSEAQWREFYCDDVHFTDPTQEKHGIKAYLTAQENLINRCDDVMLMPADVAISGNVAFIEWTMGLKVKSVEFVYPGTSRLRFNKDGLINDHRDYFDFVGPTFGPVPLLGQFVRWMYGRFVA